VSKFNANDNRLSLKIYNGTFFMALGDASLVPLMSTMNAFHICELSRSNEPRRRMISF